MALEEGNLAVVPNPEIPEPGGVPPDDPSMDFVRSTPTHPSGFYIDPATGVLMTPAGTIAPVALRRGDR